jgi:antirestriction protein ArdC
LTLHLFVLLLEIGTTEHIDMAKNYATSDRVDIYASVTNTIIAALESGTTGYKMPWVQRDIATPINVASKKRYRGVNVLVLWATAMSKGYNSNVWATFKQWQDIGAQVKKGEKSTGIVFWSKVDIKSDAANDDKQARMFAKGYNVFNAEQVEGYVQPEVVALSEEERNANADAFFDNIGATYVEDGSRAMYSPSRDEVHMPAYSAFHSAESYYCVKMHEYVHWTGSDKRLARDFSGRFGDEAYAFEELVAELGAAFGCADLQISPVVRDDHAKYIASWLKVLKGDKKAVFTAAAKAQQAVDFMLKLQPNEEIREEEMEPMAA